MVFWNHLQLSKDISLMTTPLLNTWVSAGSCTHPHTYTFRENCTHYISDPLLSLYCNFTKIREHFLDCYNIALSAQHRASPYTLFFFPFIFISWRLITLQYCSGFCHTLTWISHGVTCIPHPDPPSHVPLYPIPLAVPSAPGPSTCLMHPIWAGDLFHPR